jgi:polyhydroxyalkanoate synthesis repressor PhaR
MVNQPRLIKRYPNRKLYDSRDRRFVKLEDIASLIRQEEEIQVKDNVTGADITVSVLEQIIFQQESRRWRGAPEYSSALQDSIRMGGGIMTSFLRKTVLSALGTFILTKESMEKLMEELTKRGEISREDAPGLLKEILRRLEQNSRKIESEIKQRVEKTIRSLFPELATLEDISLRVEALSAELEALKKAKSASRVSQKKKGASRKRHASARTHKNKKDEKKES